MNATIRLVLVAPLLTSSVICHAQTALKREPIQVMQQGAVVLVDDGTCGKGKIKQVTAGNYNPMFGNENRIRKCVPKDKS